MFASQGSCITRLVLAAVVSCSCWSNRARAAYVLYKCTHVGEHTHTHSHTHLGMHTNKHTHAPYFVPGWALSTIGSSVTELPTRTTSSASLADMPVQW
jgi:hypothetical protein